MASWGPWIGSPGGRWVVSVVSIASVSLWSLSGSDSVVFVKLANQLVWRGAVGLLVAVSAWLAVGMVDVWSKEVALGGSVLPRLVGSGGVRSPLVWFWFPLG